MKTINHSELKESLKEFDLFICCSSFEERGLKVAKHFEADKIQNILICHYKKNYPEANSNLEELKGHFNNKAKVIEIYRNRPLSNYDKLFQSVLDCNFSNALLDISTFTRENFLMILKLFQQIPFKTKKLTLCYNPSKNYSSNSSKNIEKLWLSKGVRNIRAVLGYSGDFYPIKKLLLIVLVGFEVERAQIIIDNFEPSVLLLGKAPKEKSYNSELAIINELKFNKLKSLNPDSRLFEFSCIEFQPTIEALSSIIEQNSNNYNIVISPLNNKISTLAVAATVNKYPEVQICYASTNVYNINAYSSSSDDIYLIDAHELEKV